MNAISVRIYEVPHYWDDGITFQTIVRFQDGTKAEYEGFLSTTEAREIWPLARVQYFPLNKKLAFA